MQRQLLEGIRVVDFGWVATGPLTTKYLADCGAEVIKIEGRTKPDTMRYAKPFKNGVKGVNRAGRFNQWNSSKLSLALNLVNRKAVEIAKRLVARSDVVVENFRAGAIDKMGLGYEELKKWKPDIIFLSSCGLGHTGPYASNGAHGDGLAALSGISEIAGWPDRNPAALGVYTDFIGPRLNALAIMAALDYRCRTGKGQYIDMSQHEAALHFLSPLLLDCAVNGRIATRMGNRSTYAAPHGVYRCSGKDRWCAMAVSTPKEWENFCRIIGDPEWTRDCKFNTFPARKKHEDELDRLVEAWTRSRSPEEIMNMMQTEGVPAGVVATGEDMMKHNPQLTHSRFFREVDHPEVGRYAVQRTPFIPSKARFEIRRAPLLGEHNAYVLNGILGLSDSEIGDLVADGAVE